ncbi:MAG TPA: hypothetical protein VM186_00440 [Planctomycetota bacterium]|nr:hypothetical protein [Planctomycetota bacterium]
MKCPKCFHSMKRGSRKTVAGRVTAETFYCPVCLHKVVNIPAAR